LTLLELLQSYPEISGVELAQRLEVDVRSVRRYVTTLRDMGIPVESEKGRYGAYGLRPGFRLPPLMFNNAEILAIMLGLLAVQRMGLAGAPGVESAIGKIERVLPGELRDQARALRGVLTLDINTARANLPPETIATFSLAAYQRQRLWIEYQGGRYSDKTERSIDVYGLVYHAGLWYAVAYCNLRRGLRNFRLDRVLQHRLLDATFTAPSDFDALGYLLNSIANTPGVYDIRVLLQSDMTFCRSNIPNDLGMLEEVEGGVMLRTYSDGLNWIARFLINLGCAFVVHHPPELRKELRKIARALLRSAAEPAAPLNYHDPS
jgi:predicted DNA-binding transcriptional regulator YafY